MKKYFKWEYIKRVMELIQFLIVIGGVLFTVAQIKEISYNQLNVKNDRAERYYNDLNSGTNRNISIAIENKDNILVPKGKFTTDQLDDYIDSLYSVGQALNDNLLEENKVCSGFYDETIQAHNNNEIINYISNVRNIKKDNTYFADFDSLYNFIINSCQ